MAAIPDRRVRLSVVRGTSIVNVPELWVYARLSAHGFQPEFIASRQGTFSDTEVGMPVQRLPTPFLRGRVAKTLAGGYVIGRVSSYRYFHEYLVGLRRAIQGQEILVPVDLGHPTSYQCLEARPHAKVVVQVWDNIPFNWPPDRPLAKHYQAVLEGADHFLAFSRDADRALGLQGVDPSRRTQIYCGIDLSRFRPPTETERMAARQGLGLTRDQVAVAFVGRVEFHKGIFTLLEALVHADPRLTLLVVGQGSGESIARWRAERMGLRDRIRFLGSIPHSELLPRVLWGVDVLAVPSIPTAMWREQLGTIHLEAMAAQLAVVGTISGAIPELIQDGRTGLLVPPDRPEELTQALNRLAADDGLRQRLATAARREAEERFDVERSAARLADILRQKVLGV